ncbi:cohesin domain-containing protein [Geobacter sp. FeAm09]|uniref:cohesin domain-containing protein n=1 Tax=Geobacter sp. FeAm09 TaxID=2597769 RepID=UPI00143D5011|nr:cohesin domain-containing protein [Geobacter sp. FeAm09]
MDVRGNGNRAGKWFQVVVVLGMAVMLWGCGNGGDTASSTVSSTPQSNTVVSKGAFVSLAPSGDGGLVIQGNNMTGVAGIALTITYDSSVLAAPTITQGGLVAGAVMASNTLYPGTIKLAIVSNTALSGNGEIAAVSFATVAGAGNASLASVELIDSTGAPMP